MTSLLYLVTASKHADLYNNCNLLPVQVPESSDKWKIDNKWVLNVIKDPSLLVPTPLKDLKNQKGFFKVICKRDKELESLSKKHEKVGLVFI